MENFLNFIVENWFCYNFEMLVMNYLVDKMIKELNKKEMLQFGYDMKDVEKFFILKQIKINQGQIKVNRQEICQ